MKISVYAICKNEAKFVDRWIDSMQEADEIVVLDTGSTDDTVAKLRARGAKVETKVITPWRFDVARNESMKLVAPDADLLVCTDLDEILLPGWRAKLEKAWTEAVTAGRNPTTAQYEYVWCFNADGSDGTKYLYEKVHAPNTGRWAHPVHEILVYDRPKVMVRVDGMRLEHHADPTKSRGQYLALLEMSVKEAPNDDRNMHYLGREYMFYGRWNESIRTLKRHLKMPQATWRAERAASMRYIARCLGEKAKTDPRRADGYRMEQEVWLWRAIAEAPEQREAPLELAELAYDQKNYHVIVRACEACLAVKNRTMSYLTKAHAWGARPWDLYSIGLWYTGRYQEALTANEEALRLDPKDERLQANDRLMRQILAART